MSNFFTVVLTLICFGFSVTIKAQIIKTEACQDRAYSQFDFWIGHWDVYDTQGILLGENIVIQTPNACAIQENWTSKQSSIKGTSYTYYNQLDELWHQVWIDNAGAILTLKGAFKNKTMTLKSAIKTIKRIAYYDEISWTKNNDGSITQVWNRKNKDHHIINETFRGVYRKKNP